MLRLSAHILTHLHSTHATSIVLTHPVFGRYLYNSTRMRMSENEQLHRQVNELCRNLRASVWDTRSQNGLMWNSKTLLWVVPFAEATLLWETLLVSVTLETERAPILHSQSLLRKDPIVILIYLSRQDSHRVENAADHAFRTAKHLEEAHNEQNGLLWPRTAFTKKEISFRLWYWYRGDLGDLGVQVSSDFSVTKEAMQGLISFESRPW